jgi:hypothetical protein
LGRVVRRDFASTPGVAASIESKFKMALSSRRLAVALLIAATARTSYAHEHHDDAIPEGEAISPDPLVSWRGQHPSIEMWILTEITGFHIMDTYSNTNDGVWHYLPYWDGARSEPMTTFILQRWRAERVGRLLTAFCR